MEKIKTLANKLGRKIYNALDSNNTAIFFNERKKIEKEISLLNPGVRTESLVEDYFVKKIITVLYVVVAGVLLVAILVISEFTNKVISKDCAISRNEFGDGNLHYELIPKSDEYDYGIIDIEVSEKMPTDNELDMLLGTFYEELETIILGDNECFDYIQDDMNLVTSVVGYPFQLRWEIENYDLISETGELGKAPINDAYIATSIKAVVSYGAIRREKEYNIKIYPRELSYDEKMIADLKAAIEQSDINNLNENRMFLPMEINGHMIHWNEKKEHTASVLVVLIIILIIGTWRGKDMDLHKQYEIRNHNLMLAYSDIICELEMYLSAGLTIRGSIERIDKNYKIRVNQGGQRKEAYDELEICTKKLKDGANEANCYEQWGLRCGLLNYRKLTSLLSQNLRKGTDGLILALENEMRMAFEERKSMVRKRGEEAQTRLLFPMMLMLGVVMIIIMIPAYLSFGI